MVNIPQISYTWTKQFLYFIQLCFMAFEYTRKYIHNVPSLLIEMLDDSPNQTTLNSTYHAVKIIQSSKRLPAYRNIAYSMSDSVESRIVVMFRAESFFSQVMSCSNVLSFVTMGC